MIIIKIKNSNLDTETSEFLKICNMYFSNNKEIDNCSSVFVYPKNTKGGLVQDLLIDLAVGISVNFVYDCLKSIYNKYFRKSNIDKNDIKVILQENDKCTESTFEDIYKKE